MNPALPIQEAEAAVLLAAPRQATAARAGRRLEQAVHRRAWLEARAGPPAPCRMALRVREQRAAVRAVPAVRVVPAERGRAPVAARRRRQAIATASTSAERCAS